MPTMPWVLTLFWLVIEDDQVAILEVEAVQFVTSAFRVHDIFVDDKGGAFRIGGNALANLANDC